MEAPFLTGRNYYLRKLTADDIGNQYLGWINDKEVTEYLWSGVFPQSIDDLREYFAKKQNDSNIIFAIMTREGDRYIGNVTLNSIDWLSRRAELGILIGEKTYWGKGCMFEIYGLLIDYAFNKLNMQKIVLGADSRNIAAIITIKKLKFQLEAKLREHIFRNGKYVDVLRFGLLKEY